MTIQLPYCELLLSDSSGQWRAYLASLSDADLLTAHKAAVAYATEQRSDTDVERLEMLIRDTMSARFELLVKLCREQRELCAELNRELDKAKGQSRISSYQGDAS